MGSELDFAYIYAHQALTSVITHTKATVNAKVKIRKR